MTAMKDAEYERARRELLSQLATIWATAGTLPEKKAEPPPKPEWTVCLGGCGDVTKDLYCDPCVRGMTVANPIFAVTAQTKDRDFLGSVLSWKLQVLLLKDPWTAWLLRRYRKWSQARAERANELALLNKRMGK